MSTDNKENKVMSLVGMGREGIPQLLEQVNNQIKKITKGDSTETTTKGERLEPFGEICKIQNVATLVAAHASIEVRKEAYEKSADSLGVSLKKYPFKLGKYGADTWRKDIEKHINIVKHKDALNKLQKVKAELEANLSAEQKLQNSLSKIGEWMTEDE